MTCTRDNSLDNTTPMNHHSVANSHNVHTISSMSNSTMTPTTTTTTVSNLNMSLISALTHNFQNYNDISIAGEYFDQHNQSESSHHEIILENHYTPSTLSTNIPPTSVISKNMYLLSMLDDVIQMLHADDNDDSVHESYFQGN